MASPPTAVDVISVRHWYAARAALDGVTFDVRQGEMFGLLGPNGGGKTTLFQVVSTLLAPTEGRVRVFGDDVVRDAPAARRRMGVVFQRPALDGRLTVVENLRHQGHLYGLRRATLAERIRDVLRRVGLEDRARDLVGTLSGGLQRRAEVAKALLHEPQLLVLDEPSTGLDLTARRDIRRDLQRLRDERGTTIMLTTHLMDEAAACDRVGILDLGRLVCLGSPRSLVEAIGGDVIVLTARDPERLAGQVKARFGVTPELVEGRLRVERGDAREFVAALTAAFPGEIDAVTFGRPTLEDVFVHHTGRRLD